MDGKKGWHHFLAIMLSFACVALFSTSNGSASLYDNLAEENTHTLAPISVAVALHNVGMFTIELHY